MSDSYPTTGTPPMIGKRLTIQEWESMIARHTWHPERQPPIGIVLHHTAIPTVEQWDGLTSMRGMQKYYAGKGWSSAPHVYVGPDGIWLFTPLNRIGVHAGRGNGWSAGGRYRYTLGVEMVGMYDYKRPSGSVWDGTKAVLGSVCRKLRAGPRSLITFHRDYTTLKSCPGWAVTKEWVHSEVDSYMAAPEEHVTAPAPYRYVVKPGVIANVRTHYIRRADGSLPPIALANDTRLQQELAILEPGTFVDGYEINYEPLPGGKVRPWLHLISQLGWIEMSALAPR